MALLEARMGSELAQLVRRYGGIVRLVPAVREAHVDCTDAVADFMARLETRTPRVHVFLTGAGAMALFQEAERQGRLSFLVESLERGTIVCRGPKPTVALGRYGLRPHLSAASPYTSSALLDAMSAIDLDGVEVSIVHYGERSDALAGALRVRGAVLNELCVYEWRLPDDIGPLQDLARAIVTGEIDAIIFTSQVQWKHLLHVASGVDLVDRIVQALRTQVVVAAIGPVCSAAFIEAGVRPHVVPDNPKMGPLVAALAHYFSQSPDAPSPNPEPRTVTPEPQNPEPAPLHPEPRT